LQFKTVVHYHKVFHQPEDGI